MCVLCVLSTLQERRNNEIPRIYTRTISVIPYVCFCSEFFKNNQTVRVFAHRFISSMLSGNAIRDVNFANLHNPPNVVHGGVRYMVTPPPSSTRVSVCVFFHTIYIYFIL